MSAKEPLAKGALARDTQTGKVGEVMDIVGTRYWLRRQGGGREWDVDSAHVEPYRLSDQLADRIREERKKRVPR